MNVPSLRTSPRQKLWFSLLLVSTVLLSACRLVFLLTNVTYWDTTELPEVAHAFLLGLRFDAIVTAWLLLPPLLIFTVLDVLRSPRHRADQIVLYYIYGSYTLLIFLYGTDSAFFQGFFQRLNRIILNWTDDAAYLMDYVLSEPTYYPFIGSFVLSILVFWWVAYRLFRHFIKQTSSAARANPWLALVFFAIVGWGTVGFGSLAHPLRTAGAYFSDNPFLNQVGLNPIVTLTSSVWTSNPTYLGKLDSSSSLRYVQQLLKVDSSQVSVEDPLARYSSVDKAPNRFNVVLVLMESMTASALQRFGNTTPLTPFLDSLYQQSYSFDRLYSAGIHTYDGVYATLFSFPPPLGQHPLYTDRSPPFPGLASVLKQHKYQTVFFTTHNRSFDNLGPFLQNNEYDQVVSAENYDAQELISTWGVPDHRLFEYGLSYLDSLDQQTHPFLAVFLTGSNHPPFVLPENLPLTPVTDNPREQMIQYADWSLRQFFDASQRKPWFDSTLFVFVADHGITFEKAPHDMPLSRNHIPGLLYNQALLPQPRVETGFAQQLDIGPTILDVLHISFTNNSLGISLRQHKRPYAFFTADDKVGCLDENYFYVYHTDRPPSLYVDYPTQRRTEPLARHPHQVDRMRHYALSMMNVATRMTQKEVAHQP